MICMDERKEVRRKNRIEAFRRLGAELQYMTGVMIAYVLIYLFFYCIYEIVRYFISIKPVISLFIELVLFYVTAKCTRIVAGSKAFNRNVLNPKN